MLKKNQIILIASVVVLMGVLYSLDIKGLVKKDEHSTGATTMPENAPSVTSVTLESVSETASHDIDPGLAQQITALENTLKSAPEEQKLTLRKELAKKWDDVNQPAPGAFYYEAISGVENTYDNWIKTGDLFTAGYQNTNDEGIQSGLAQKAINAYQKALALSPGNLEAQTGLGSAYVNAGQNPMQGIQLLLEVVKKDPQNVKANTNLGLFSIKSGQFDKAVERFKTVVAKDQHDASAWFYLGSSYESLGQKEEAIAAFTKSKELAGNPNLTKYVDDKILELRKN